MRRKTRAGGHRFWLHNNWRFIFHPVLRMKEDIVMFANHNGSNDKVIYWEETFYRIFPKGHSHE